MLLAADGAVTADELDRIAERWLAEACDVDADFEIDDALDKLKRLGIAQKDRRGRWTPVELTDALDVLDRRWDDLFRLEPADDELAEPESTTSTTPPEEPEPENDPALLRLRRVVDRFRSRLGERLTDAS